MYYIISHILLSTQDEQGNQEEVGNQQTNTAISMLERERRMERKEEQKRSGKREKENRGPR